MKQYNNITELFVLDFYDVELSMVVMDEDENYLYACLADEETGTYNLYTMTTEQLCLVLGQNELFKRYVGEHWTFTNGQLNYNKASSKSTFDKYYTMFKCDDGYKSFHRDIKIDSPVGFYIR